MQIHPRQGVGLSYHPSIPKSMERRKHCGEMSWSHGAICHLPSCHGVIWYGLVLPRVFCIYKCICIFSVSPGTVRALRKGRRKEMGCLYMARNKMCCRSEKVEYVNCNEFVGLMFTLWLWGESKWNFRLSRDSVFYAKIKLQHVKCHHYTLLPMMLRSRRGGSSFLIS